MTILNALHARFPGRKFELSSLTLKDSFHFNDCYVIVDKHAVPGFYSPEKVNDHTVSAGTASLEPMFESIQKYLDKHKKSFKLP